jgi:signal transduction histidine kinase
MGPSASPLVFGSLVAGGTSLALAAYAWYGRDEPGATSFGLLMGGATVWSLSYAVALATFDPVLRLAFEVPIEVGKALIAPAWLAFALGYTGRSSYLSRRTVAAIGLVPVATLLFVALPSLRPLMWTGYRVVPTLGAATVVYDPGPWHFVHAAYGYVLVGIGMALLVNTLVSSGSLYRDQTVALVVGSAVPTVAHVKRTFGLGPLAPVDLTPMALAVMGLTFGYALFRFELFDLVPATSYRGRQAAVDDLGVGVAIVTTDDRIVELNAEAERLFGDADAFVGEPLSELVPTHAAEGGTFDRVVDGRRRTLEVVPAAVDDAHDRTVGRTIAFHDVTDRESRRQRLEVLNRVLRHNLRNEMTVVMGYADVLAESLPDDEARLARTIEDRSAALADLGEKARELESMMKSADEVSSTVVLADVVGDVVADVETDLEAGDTTGSETDPAPTPEFETDVPSALTVETNERVLRTVLSTVVENAVEHNDDPEPWVGVSAHAAATDGGVTAGDGVVVEVRDDGPGIPDHELAVVDEGEETPLNHGSGLGLWILQWGSRRLGADVDVETGSADLETDDGRGTTVRLRL